MVEEVHGPLDEPLVPQGDDLCQMLRLLSGDVVEVLQGGRQPVAALVRPLEGKLHAALDDGLIHLGEGLSGFRSRRARLREHGVDLERDLLAAGQVLHAHRVERVQVGAGAHAEMVGGAAVPVGDGGVFARTVDDVDFVRGVGEDGACHLGLDEHALAGTGLAAHEAHGAGQPLAVADDKVPRMLVLPVVVAALVVQLLRGEGHEDGDLRSGEHAADLHMVVTEGQDRVQAPALPVIVGVHLDGGLAGHRDDAHDLLVQLLLGGRVGVDETGEHVEPLVLVLQVVQHVLGLLLGILQLLREDAEIVPLVHRRTLLLDDLLVDPRGTAAHEVDGLRLVHGLHVPRDLHGDGQVHDVRQSAVGEFRAELLHDEHLPVHAVVQLEAVVVHAVRLEVDLRGRDAVLGGLHAAGGDVALVVEVERLVWVQQAVDDPEPLGAVQQMWLGPHGVQDAAGFRFDAGELPGGVLRRVRRHGIGQVAVAADVAHALLHLVVQDVVEQLGVVAGRVGGLGVGVEEPPVAHLLPQEGRVDDAHLHEGVRAELVVQAGQGGEHGLLLFVAHAVVAGVVERDGRGEQALLHLADAVLIHPVVPDVVGDGLRRLSLASEALGLVAQFLIPVLELGLDGLVAALGGLLRVLRLPFPAGDVALRGLLLLPGELAPVGGAAAPGRDLPECIHVDGPRVVVHGAGVDAALACGVDKLINVEVGGHGIALIVIR